MIDQYPSWMLFHCTYNGEVYAHKSPQEKQAQV